MYQLQAVFACLASFPQRLTHLFLCSKLHRQFLLLGKQYRCICQKIQLLKPKRRKKLLGTGRPFTINIRQQTLPLTPSPMSCIWHGIQVLEIKSYSTEAHGSYTTCSLSLQQQSRTFATFCSRRHWKLSNKEAIFCGSFSWSLYFNQTRL